MRRLTAALAVVAVAVAVAVAGCGGGPSPAERAAAAECRRLSAQAALVTVPVDVDAASRQATALAAGLGSGTANDDATRLAAKLDARDFAAAETAAAALVQSTKAAEAAAGKTCGHRLSTAVAAMAAALPPVAKTALIAKADGLCRVEKQAVAALPPPDKHSSGSYGYFRDQQKLASALMVDLHALSATRADTPGWQAFLDATEKLVNQLEELSRAAAFNDDARLRAADQAVSTLGANADAAAQAFGLTQCRSTKST